ncbi:EMB2654 [Symbiodinium natans]|uniref:EMB2654 protein n=1 Tax=Symbiodinium natans TaxID=878477 RepID=A0A812J1J1_9DINO|nr:EMB2654 [Symbiodinium natans]
MATAPGQTRKRNSRKHWLWQQLRSLRPTGQTVAGRLQIARLLSELQETGHLASAQEYSAAIQALGSAGWWQEALALFEVARSPGTDKRSTPLVDARMYNAAIAALRSSPFRWQHAFLLLHAMSDEKLQPDTATVNSVATALKGELLWQQTLSAYSAAAKQGLCMDEVGTNILLAAMVAVDCRWSRGMESLRSARLSKIKPDVCSLGCAVGILSSQSQWAQSCWQLRAANSDLDTVALNSAMSGTEEASHWAVGLSLLTTATLHQLQVDSITFNVVLSAANKHGAWRQGTQCLEWLRQTGEPTLVSYNSLLNADEPDGDGRRWEAAVQILEDMMDSPRVCPDPVTACSVGNILQAFAQWEQALVLVKSSAHEGPSAAPLAASSAPALGTALGAAERAGCWERALDLIWWAQAVNAAITSFSRGSRWRTALAIVESMDWSQLRADVFTCTSAISSCEKAVWVPALQLLQRMQRCVGMESAWPAVNAAVSACGSSRSWRWPLELIFGTGTAAGFMQPSNSEAQPGVAAMFLALSEEGRWKDALQLRKEITFRSLQPDVASCGLLMMQCEQEGLAGQEVNMLRSLCDIASGL